VLLSGNFARQASHCYFTIQNKTIKTKLPYRQLQLFWCYFDEQQIQREVAAAVAGTEIVYHWEHRQLW
jgi:hypothetical protein